MLYYYLTSVSLLPTIVTYLCISQPADGVYLACLLLPASHHGAFQPFHASFSFLLRASLLSYLLQRAGRGGRHHRGLPRASLTRRRLRGVDVIIYSPLDGMHSRLLLLRYSLSSSSVTLAISPSLLISLGRTLFVCSQCLSRPYCLACLSFYTLSRTSRVTRLCLTRVSHSAPPPTPILPTNCYTYLPSTTTAAAPLHTQHPASPACLPWAGHVAATHLPYCYHLLYPPLLLSFSPPFLSPQPPLAALLCHSTFFVVRGPPQFIITLPSFLLLRTTFTTPLHCLSKHIACLPMLPYHVQRLHSSDHCCQTATQFCFSSRMLAPSLCHLFCNACANTFCATMLSYSS